MGLASIPLGLGFFLSSTPYVVVGGGQGEENNSTVMNRVYLKPAADD